MEMSVGQRAQNSLLLIGRELVEIVFEQRQRLRCLGSAVVGPMFDASETQLGTIAELLFSLLDRKSTRLNSSHNQRSRMPSSA